MAEGTLRKSHQRRYLDEAGQRAEVTVNDHGFVEISEELMDQLLTGSGFTETLTWPGPDN